MPTFPRPDLMSVEQTWTWIWWLGNSVGWDPADCYANAESFRQKKISWSQLAKMGVDDFKRENMVKKLGHKLEIVKRVKEALKDRMYIMDNKSGNYPGYPVSYGTQLSNCEQDVKLEPLVPPRRRFGRKWKNNRRKSKNTRRKQNRSRRSVGNGFHPNRDVTLTRNKAKRKGRLHKSDESSITQQCRPAIRRTQAACVFSAGGVSHSSKHIEEKLATSPGCNTDQNEKLTVGLQKDNMARSSYVVAAPIEKPKKITVLTESAISTVSENYGSNSTHSCISSSGSAVFPEKGSSCAKLLHQCNVKNEQDLVEKFRKFGYEVEIEQVEGKLFNIVKFPDTKSAEQAFQNRHKLGYSLEKYRQHKWNQEGTPRPSPKRPRPYLVNSRLEVRSGKSTESPLVAYLEKGAVVIVNQLKKRRARIVKLMEHGEPEEIGWVWTHSKTAQLLAPI